MSLTNLSAGLDAALTADLEEEAPEAWQTWFYGLLIMTVTCVSSPLAMMMVPLLSPSLYIRCMTFLVALGIGAMSGSCLFILLPHSFNITEVTSMDYLQKCWLIVGALYGFFAIDRTLQCLLELRRRKQGKARVHVATLNKVFEKGMATEEMVNGEIQLKERSSEEDVKMKTDLEKIQNEIDVSMLSNALSRTFSTRTRIAVLKQDHLDGIQYKSPTGSVLEVDECGLTSRPISRCHSTRPTPLQSPLNSPKPMRRHSHHKVDVSRDEAWQGNGNHLNANNNHDVNANLNNNESVVQKTDMNNKVKHQHGIAMSLSDINEDSEGQVDVDVEVHERKVINKKELEVASVAYMIIFGSAANNFVDGMSIGAAFSDSVIRGISIGMAVVSQQFPQELGTLAILINSGLGLKRTLLFQIIPIILSYLGFGAGVMLDNMDDSYDSFIFSVSAGMYLYIFLGTLIPEIRDSFNELLKTDLGEALLTTVLQFSGIMFGTTFMFVMNITNDEI